MNSVKKSINFVAIFLLIFWFIFFLIYIQSREGAFVDGRNGKLYQYYIYKSETNEYFCLLEQNKILFCVNYNNLPSDVSKCLFFNSPIILINYSAYKYCGNGNILNMSQMQLFNKSDFKFPNYYFSIKNNYNNNLKIYSETIQYLNTFQRIKYIPIVYQGNTKLCGYFSEMMIFDYYNDTKSSNYVKEIISKNINKDGVSINDLVYVLRHNKYNFTVSKINENYDPCENNTIKIIFMKFMKDCCYHSRVVVNCYDNSLIHVLDSDMIYGVSPVGKILFSKSFFKNLIYHDSYEVIIWNKIIS